MGPQRRPAQKVSGATLVDWAAWAASTTFSSTGRGFGYDVREVDAFLDKAEPRLAAMRATDKGAT